MVEDFREAARCLITSVALITTRGRHGANVMSAEWTFQVSYQPMRLIVLVNPEEATHDNLMDTREFGANFLSDEQAALAHNAGYYTGKEVNKLSSELFRTHHAKGIQAPMISGCFLNAECRVAQIIEAGDHTMFLGDALNVQFDKTKDPLLYSQRRYWHRGSPVEKQPAIYLACTIRHNHIRLDGRLVGAEKYPQSIALEMALLKGEKRLEAKIETDDNGYFELRRELNAALPKGYYLATAKWNQLMGSALSEA